MAKNKRMATRDHPMTFIEAFLNRKAMRKQPTRREPPIIEHGRDGKTDGSLIPTPQTGAGRAVVLNSQHGIYQAGFTYQGSAANLAVPTGKPGTDGGLTLRFYQDSCGLSLVEPSRVMPHDNGQMVVWLEGLDTGGSDQDYDYILSVHQYSGGAGTDEESLVVRWEPDMAVTPTGDGELRLYPDLHNYPTTYAMIELATADWQEGAWCKLTATWSYVTHEWTLTWVDSSGGTLTSTLIEPVTPDDITWPSWDESTHVECFTDLAGENSAYHDASFLEFGQSQHFITPGKGTLQNLFKTVAADLGTVVATIPTDTLHVQGTGHLSTGTLGLKTITISSANPRITVAAAPPPNPIINDLWVKII